MRPYFLSRKLSIDIWLVWCFYESLSWKSPEFFNSNPCHQPPGGWSWWNISSGFTSSLRQRKGLVSDRRLFVFKHNGLLTTYNGHYQSNFGSKNEPQVPHLSFGKVRPNPSWGGDGKSRVFNTPVIAFLESGSIWKEMAELPRVTSLMSQMCSSAFFVRKIHPKSNCHYKFELFKIACTLNSAKKIFILRSENGVTKKTPFNNQVVKGKHLDQNIILQKGDMSVTP